MLDKFNLYDLLGYLLPGAIVALYGYWIAENAFGRPFPPLSTDFGGSVFFLGLSYVFGQFVQAIGNWYESRLSARRGGRLSERLLALPDDAHIRQHHRFSNPSKAEIKKLAQQVFGLGAEPRCSKDAHTWRQELFERVYALVVQKGLAQHTEIFLAINGLARGLYIATWFGVLASLGMLGKRLWFDHSDLGDPLVRWALLALVGFILGAWLARRVFRDFGMYFAKSVYYNFVAWCATESRPIIPPRHSRWPDLLAGIAGFAAGRMLSRRAAR
jgi:hypothetical protein